MPDPLPPHRAPETPGDTLTCVTGTQPIVCVCREAWEESPALWYSVAGALLGADPPRVDVYGKHMLVRRRE
jgi:hypothetical protein